MLSLPTLTMPFSHGSDDETQADTSFPSLFEDGKIRSDVISQLGSWYGENFGYRSQLVTAYGWLTSNFFATSAEADVVIGKNDWLYYAPTIPDHIGENDVDTQEIACITRTLSLINDYANENGSEFVVAIAPNKASIYPEHLPARYLARTNENSLDMLHNDLAETNVRVCDWRCALQEQADQDPAPLYHQLDSHWNGYGAMTAFSTLMRTFHLDDNGFPQANITAVQDFDGDLWRMLAPSVVRKDWNYVYDLPKTYAYLGRYRDEDDLVIQTSNPNGEGSLLMVRDSFGRALIPLLSQKFETCTYLRDLRVPLEQISQNNTQYVVYELVERNIDYLLQYAPQMPAPSVTLTGELSAMNVQPTQVQTRYAGSSLHIYGFYDPTYADESVYVRIRNTATNDAQTYAAFPCYEADLLGESEPKSNGFSLYLPNESVPESAELTVLVENSGNLLALDTVMISAPNR